MSTAAKFTLDEFHRMIEKGAFIGLQKRIELFRGELRMMNPQGARHAEVVSQLSDWSYDDVDRQQIRIRIQSPIEIAGQSTEPEPDVVWAINKKYSRHPQPDEILLLIEVADHSLTYDQGEKCVVYAEAGIPEYWIVDIPHRTIHVYRQPANGVFQTCCRCTETDRVSPHLISGVSCAAGDAFNCLID